MSDLAILISVQSKALLQRTHNAITYLFLINTVTSYLFNFPYFFKQYIVSKNKKVQCNTVKSTMKLNIVG